MELILFIFGALLSSFLLGELFKKLNMPQVLGPLLLGLILGQEPLINMLHSDNNLELLTFIKELAIIFLLFFVGLKIDLRDFRKTSTRSLFVSLFAALIPLALGFFSIIILNSFGLLGFMGDVANIYLVAFVVGICFSITAEGVIIEILEELGLMRTIVGETVIESGIIDDIIGIFLISALVALLPGQGSSSVGLAIANKIFEMIMFTAIIFIVGYYFVPKIMKAVEKEKSTVSFFSVSIMIALFLALTTKFFELGGSILGALFGGIIIRHALLSGDEYERKEENYITSIIEVTTFGFFAPFFFMWIGINVNLPALFEYPLYAILFVVMATLGKVVGSTIGNRMAKGKHWEGMIIGWGMNTRSGVDIMVASLALSVGIISVNLFSILILTSFITTIISPVMFKYLVKHHHRV
ncbi:MAG: cation:proton antiporter [Nanobdellota archaeon]